jgi:hypothetical protein
LDHFEGFRTDGNFRRCAGLLYVLKVIEQRSGYRNFKVLKSLLSREFDRLFLKVDVRAVRGSGPPLHGERGFPKAISL